MINIYNVSSLADEGHTSTRMPHGPHPAYSIFVFTVPGSRQFTLTPKLDTLSASSAVNTMLQDSKTRLLNIFVYVSL
jgi:hypothetical protein